MGSRISGAVSTPGTSKRADENAHLSLINSFVIANGFIEPLEGRVLLRDTSNLHGVNTTIANNSSSSSFGGVDASESATSTLTNMIFWNNSPDQCGGCELGTDSLDGSVDPLFASSSELMPEDYRISQDSPARGIGIVEPCTPEDDFWEQPRNDGEMDSGAHEYRP